MVCHSSNRPTVCSPPLNGSRRSGLQVPRRHAGCGPESSGAQGLNIPKTGQQGSVGLMVTKTLVILGDPQVTTTPEHPRGAMLRAYNKQTGEQVGAVWMPAPQSGSPMTYSVGGKQYIVIAISG